jgi:hypothetical protein
MVASGVKELLSIGCILRNYLHRSGSSDQHLRGLGVLLRFSCCDYLSSILKVKAHQREAGAFMNECGKPINLFVTYRGQGTSPANSISQRKERALFQYWAPSSPSLFSKVYRNGRQWEWVNYPGRKGQLPLYRRERKGNFYCKYSIFWARIPFPTLGS